MLTLLTLSWLEQNLIDHFKNKTIIFIDNCDEKKISSLLVKKILMKLILNLTISALYQISFYLI